MKIAALAMLGLTGSYLLGADLNPAPATAYPSYTLPNTVCRVLPRTAPDRIYELYIGLPDSFSKQPERMYPVILATEGQWSFAGVTSAARGLAYGKHIPEALVVGLSYEGENLDYAKIRDLDLIHGTYHGDYEGGGHSERYLDLIEKQVLPLLEKEYRADSGHRYILGTSEGANFVLYAMLSKPNLFQGYVADSPWIIDVWSMERAFAAAGRTVAGRVFISSAQNEWTEYRKWTPMIYERMKRLGIVKGGLVYRETPGVRHTAGTSEAYMRGLMYVMEPLAPEKGVATDQFVEPPGKRSFLVSFWSPKTAASPEAVASTRRDHEAYMAKLISEKRANFEFLDSEYAPDSAGTLLVDAASRAEVVAMVLEDPAVKAKMVEFEVLGE
jgi:predicted alpha/beta superfamily hydrolase